MQRPRVALVVASRPADGRRANPRLMSTHWLGMPAWRHGTVSVESHAPQRVAPSSRAIQRARTMPPHAARRARRPAEGRPSQGQPSAEPCTLGMWCRGFWHHPMRSTAGAPAPRESPTTSQCPERVRERVARVEDAESEGESLSAAADMSTMEDIAHVPHLQESVEPLAEFAGRRSHHTRAWRERDDANSMLQLLEGQTKELTSSSQCTSTLPQNTSHSALGACGAAS